MSEIYRIGQKRIFCSHFCAVYNMRMWMHSLATASLTSIFRLLLRTASHLYSTVHIHIWMYVVDNISGGEKRWKRWKKAKERKSRNFSWLNCWLCESREKKKDLFEIDENENEKRKRFVCKYFCELYVTVQGRYKFYDFSRYSFFLQYEKVLANISGGGGERKKRPKNAKFPPSLSPMFAERERVKRPTTATVFSFSWER